MSDTIPQSELSESRGAALPSAEMMPSAEALPPPGSREPLTLATRVRVQIPEEDLTYETIKTAIYAQARYLYDHDQPIRRLFLSSRLFEILNRRLVFKTAAHKDAPHFITPFGNLGVEKMDADAESEAGSQIDERDSSALSFIIEE